MFSSLIVVTSLFFDFDLHPVGWNESCPPLDWRIFSVWGPGTVSLSFSDAALFWRIQLSASRVSKRMHPGLQALESPFNVFHCCSSLFCFVFPVFVEKSLCLLLHLEGSYSLLLAVRHVAPLKVSGRCAELEKFIPINMHDLYRR